MFFYSISQIFYKRYWLPLHTSDDPLGLIPLFIPIMQLPENFLVGMGVWEEGRSSCWFVLERCFCLCTVLWRQWEKWWMKMTSRIIQESMSNRIMKRVSPIQYFDSEHMILSLRSQGNRICWWDLCFWFIHIFFVLTLGMHRLPFRWEKQDLAWPPVQKVM